MEILVYVLPNSSSTQELGSIEINPDNPYYNRFKEAIKIKLKSKAVENAANKELIDFLAKKYSVTKSSIVIQKGDKSRYKLVHIDD